MACLLYLKILLIRLWSCCFRLAPVIEEIGVVKIYHSSEIKKIAHIPLKLLGNLSYLYSSLYVPDSIDPVAVGSTTLFCVCWDITVSFQAVRDNLRWRPLLESVVLNSTRPCKFLSWLIENVIVLVGLSYTPLTLNCRILLLFYRTSITFAVSVLSFLTVTCPVDGLYLAMQTLSLP